MSRTNRPPSSQISPNSEPLFDYYGFHLSEAEYRAMRDLEWVLGKNIPPFSSADFVDLDSIDPDLVVGCVIENHHVVKVNLLEYYSFDDIEFPRRGHEAGEDDEEISFDTVHINYHTRESDAKLDARIEAGDYRYDPAPNERFLRFLPSVADLIHLTHFNHHQLDENSEIPEYTFRTLPPLERSSLLELIHNSYSISSNAIEYWVSSGHVKQIIIKYCHMHTIPPSISSFGQLDHLELLDVPLNVIPEEICQLRDFEVLIIRSTSVISDIPACIGSLTNLKILNLSGLIREIPDSVGVLQNLQKLVLSGNRLENLPDSIGQLKNLRTLSLIDNRFRLLPEKIFELHNLEVLWLNSNFLESISDEIGNFTKLRILDLSDNYLKGLPSSLLKLQYLDRFTADKNVYGEFDAAFESIRQKIANNKHLSKIELNHPRLQQWAPLLEKDCLKFLESRKSDEKNQSTAEFLLQIFRFPSFDSQIWI